MIQLPVGWLYRLAWTFLVLGPELPTSLSAQAELSRDSSATHFTIPGEAVDALPVDRPEDALLLQAGVTTSNAGDLLLRGSKAGDAALFIDGIPIVSGFRSTPFFRLSRSQYLDSPLGVSPNIVGSIDVHTGPLPAAVGNGQSGAISILTREAAGGVQGGLSYETDEPFGSGASVGLNRLEANISARLLRGLSLTAGGLLQGERSIGSGFDAELAPIFVAAGIDTTVAVPLAPGDPFSDTTRVAVENYAVSRGTCDTFARSSNPDIAANYDLPCHGSLTPQSALSSYQVLGKLSYDLGRGSGLTLLGLANQGQNRNFDYGTLYNSAGVTGNRTTSGLVGLIWHQPLIRESGRALLLNASLSSQWDRKRSGPLTLQEVQSTADPFGGFLVRPLDLLFDFDNFPVDGELLRNYRLNLPGSRRSPYDLENTAQYAVVDQYRNNAYGLYNRDEVARTTFPERGGPLGLLTLDRERRTVAAVGLSWQLSRSSRLRVGGEFTRYSIDHYSHFLESQQFSDVYLEQPVRAAFFIQDQIRLGPALLTAGIRYDSYNTRARRPADFPRISTHPSFNPTNPDAFLTSDTFFPKDEGHSRFSPHLQASFGVSPRITVRGGVARQAQVPDMRLLLLGINTDLGIASNQQVFGQDLDFERTDIFELGARHLVTSDLALDVSVYSKSIQSDITTRLVSRLDPLSGVNRILPVLTNDRTGRVRGVDLKLERSWGAALSGWLGYSYQDAKVDVASGILGTGTVSVPLADSRPHSLTGALALSVPEQWKPGSALGGILRNVAVLITFRFASGTPYTRCPIGSGNESALSPDLCPGDLTEPINGARLPAFKQLDLRLTKSFGPGQRLTGYLDARNLLNFANVLAVFTVTGETGSPTEQASNWQADSLDLASEASVAGALRADGSIDLGAGRSDPRAGCGSWTTANGTPAAPNCVYLIRAEERFGNGDHLFDTSEQRRASDALYQVVRGRQELTGPGRRVRLGLGVGF
jgi:outer membrane receptor for ferrienterochelin and colicin